MAGLRLPPDDHAASPMPTEYETSLDRRGEDGDRLGTLEHRTRHPSVRRCHDFLDDGRGVPQPFGFIRLSRDRNDPAQNANTTDHDDWDIIVDIDSLSTMISQSSAQLTMHP